MQAATLPLYFHAKIFPIIYNQSKIDKQRIRTLICNVRNNQSGRTLHLLFQSFQLLFATMHTVHQASRVTLEDPMIYRCNLHVVVIFYHGTLN